MALCVLHTLNENHIFNVHPWKVFAIAIVDLDLYLVHLHSPNDETLKRRAIAVWILFAFQLNNKSDC